MRFGVEHHPVLQVAALLAVLKQHQRGDAEGWHNVLKNHVHRQAKHVAMEKTSENVRKNGQSENGEQVFSFETPEGDSRAEIPIYRCHFERHLRTSYLTPAVPRATKNSASRTRPDRSRQRPAATKCLIHPSVGWIRETTPMRSAPAATCKPAYTGMRTLQIQLTRVTKDSQ